MPKLLALFGLWPRAVAWLMGLRWAWVHHALAWGSKHTGIPAIVLAAIAIVLLYRVAERSARFLAQVSLVLAVLAILTSLGYLRF